MEPDTMALLSEHCGIVEAPLSRVRDLLLAVPIGRMLGRAAPLVVDAHPETPVVISGGPAVFDATVAGIPMTIDVGREGGWVQTRSQDWRCLRFNTRQHPDGVLIVQQTYSLATGRDREFLTATLGRWHALTERQALTRLLDALAGQLACRVRMLGT